MNKRMYYTPTVALSGQIDQNFYRGGLGSEPLPDYDFFNTTGSTSIVVSYPLFDGNRRKINLQKSKIQHLQLSTQIDNLNQNLALQVRINTINLLTSGTKINYSKTSAKNTKNNFDLVQKNYKQGTVSITQLIDAQKAAFTSQQAYSLSIYNYLLDFLTLENSIGFYSMLNTEEENAAFENRYLEHIKNN
jgi:outer membrane protein TolC